MEKMTALLPPDKGLEIMSLWQEYEDMETPEAKFAKACDKLEATAQSLMFDNVGYWRDYDPDFYYDCVINERREKFWRHEPVLKEFSGLMRDITKKRMDAEGIDYKKYIK
jgi:5'-deoxynucleotidase YfbR-like HD superfamily hydrolase